MRYKVSEIGVKRMRERKSKTIVKKVEEWEKGKKGRR